MSTARRLVRVLGQTGRRADGESFWAAMAAKYMYGTGIGGYTFQVKICEDLSLSPDFCSSATQGRL